MADTYHTPANRHNPQDSSLGRRHRGFLNPILEEDSDDGYVRNAPTGMIRRRRGDASQLKIEAWLSPMSDHFPTPRGNHYLAAPVLPSSPSTDSGAESSPTTSSNPWNRASTLTEATEFEDLYDVSDEEMEPTKLQRRPSVRSRRASAKQQPTPLIIPTGRDQVSGSFAPGDEFKKLTSPVPLTPSANLVMSPAQMSFMDQQQALELPTISAPPSLDGSLSSEQLAALSAPPTPVQDDEEATTEEAWSGVQLQPGALATLHRLSHDEEELQQQPSQVIELPQEPLPEMQQQPLRLVTSFQPLQPHASSVIHSPSPKRQSFADLTKLDIPSPGGFFSGLSPRTRTTWHPLDRVPEDMAPPTSTTAEQFYKCPWNADASVPSVAKLSKVPRAKDTVEDFYRNIKFTPAPTDQPIVEQVIEFQDDDMSDDMPTARPIANRNSEMTVENVKSPLSPTGEVVPTEIVVDYDPDYARKQQEEALGNLDRTELWLMAQRAYLRNTIIQTDAERPTHLITEILEETVEEAEPEVATETEPAAEEENSPAKKTVRFSNVITTTMIPKRLPSLLVRQESAYYRAFQDYIIRAHGKDAFIHQLARFEALQAQRVSLRDTHRSQLLGKYQLSVVPQSAKKRLSANVARGDDDLIDDPEKLRREKEAEAMNQMTTSAWHVAAMKMLNGGRLISAPVTKRLARLSRMAPGKDGITRDRARILDLGGQATCDWAWHCALQFPNTKIYTVTTKAIRQLSNSNIRGPPNHRQVAVERLTNLPFADDQFDLISARELHSILKLFGENGEDEWETCLQECLRVLKPGGYLEFSLLDSDIMNAGPVGLAKSVEFGFALKTLGYDPNPTKLWLNRLARAGFQDVRRAWLCLPMGAKTGVLRPPVPPKNSIVGAPESNAPVMGSSDNIASACSMVGGWSWEKWLLRCEMEKVSGELRLVDTVTTGVTMAEAGKCLDGVSAVIEEGRGRKSAFRMLNGYARKPRIGTEMIQIALSE